MRLSLRSFKKSWLFDKVSLPDKIDVLGLLEQPPRTIINIKKRENFICGLLSIIK